MADPVVLHPADVLRARCEPVVFDDETRVLGRRLIATMEAAGGIGLAAPQIGVALRAIAVGIMEEAGVVPVLMFNPVILWSSARLTPLAEGCLSIPGRRFLVERPDAVEVAYTDAEGRRVGAKLGGIAAKCVQHEIDHLDGILIIDRGEELVPAETASVPKGA